MKFYRNFSKNNWIRQGIKQTYKVALRKIVELFLQPSSSFANNDFKISFHVLLCWLICSFFLFLFFYVKFRAVFSSLFTCSFMLVQYTRIYFFERSLNIVNIFFICFFVCFFFFFLHVVSFFFFEIFFFFFWMKLENYIFLWKWSTFWWNLRCFLLYI